MIVADWVAIGIAAFALLAGYIMGFGKGLTFITKGIVGFIISVVICWFFYGIVLNWGFVQELVQKLVNYLESSDNSFLKILLKIRIDLIVVAIVLFIVVQVARMILNKFVENVFESDNALMVVLNKTLGMALMLAFFTIIILIVFQVVAMVNAKSNFIIDNVQGSFFHIDDIFNNNPLKGFIDALLASNPF